MPADLVVKGGTVYDGTGSPGYRADLALTDGLVSDIAPNLEGKQVLDASGCVVAPGFIDIHTHFDAQVFWDRQLKPSSYHGVTTVVAGNCGFTIAPCRPEHHDTIVHTLENVEGMDANSLKAGILWDFETFPEYLDLVTRRGTTLNFTAYIGHSALRLYAMGDAAYERAASSEEIETMVRLVREALANGAAGFSTSFSFAHRGVDGKPVPSRLAEMDEVEALFMVAGQVGKGVVLTTPGWQCEYPDVWKWQPKVGRPFTCPLFALANGRHQDIVKWHEEGLARGANVWPQVTPRPLTMQFTLADAYNLNTGNVFAELMNVSKEARKAAFRDREWRVKAYEDFQASTTGMKPRWETFEISETERYPELVGRRVIDVAAERGVGPFDLMCELSLGEDLKTRFRAYIANDDPDAVAMLLNEEHTALGLTDAGAHVDQLCDAPLPTDLLGNWVRDRGTMSLQKAIRKLTGEPADMFGFDRRGYLREGYYGDVTVFDPATVSPGPLRRLQDLPANGQRLTAEEPVGLRHVVVNGTPIRQDEIQLELESFPGRHAALS
jgi:N-acyl-D-aspartate/D-glutamate deacylase